MLGLASTLATSLSDKVDNYASLTGAHKNKVSVTLGTPEGGSVSFDDSRGNGIAFNSNYNTSSTFRGNFTVSCWYKTADGRSGDKATKSIASISEGAGGADIWDFSVASMGALQASGSSNGDGQLAITLNQYLADGAVDWTHLAWVVTGGGGSDTSVACYVNGVAATIINIQVISSTNHAAFNADNGLYVGSSGNVTTNGASVAAGIVQNDFIDDFCLHSSALDANNIAEIGGGSGPINLLANSGNYNASGDVVLYYKFNGANDSSGCLLDSHGTSNGTGGQFSTESAS